MAGPSFFVERPVIFDGLHRKNRKWSEICG